MSEASKMRELTTRTDAVNAIRQVTTTAQQRLAIDGRALAYIIDADTYKNIPDGEKHKYISLEQVQQGYTFIQRSTLVDSDGHGQLCLEIAHFKHGKRLIKALSITSMAYDGSIEQLRPSYTLRVDIDSLENDEDGVVFFDDSGILKDNPAGVSASLVRAINEWQATTS